jgi:hypothetical protein
MKEKNHGRELVSQSKVYVTINSSRARAFRKRLAGENRSGAPARGQPVCHVAVTTCHFRHVATCRTQTTGHFCSWSPLRIRMRSAPIATLSGLILKRKWAVRSKDKVCCSCIHESCESEVYALLLFHFFNN